MSVKNLLNFNFWAILTRDKCGCKGHEWKKIGRLKKRYNKNQQSCNFQQENTLLKPDSLFWSTFIEILEKTSLILIRI